MNRLLFIHVRCLTAIYITLLLLCIPLPINAAGVVSITLCERVTKLGAVPVGIKDKFIPQTLNIHAVAVLKNLKKDTKIRGSWIAINTIKPPNYQISFEETRVKKDGNAKVHFSTPRPAKGWPSGNYRFDLYINDSLFHTVPFSIVPDAEPKAPVSFSRRSSGLRRRSGINSAEISKGTEAVRTPCSREDSISSAGNLVLDRMIQTAAIAGVPGLR